MTDKDEIIRELRKELPAKDQAGRALYAATDVLIPALRDLINASFPFLNARADLAAQPGTLTPVQFEALVQAIERAKEVLG